MRFTQIIVSLLVLILFSSTASLAEQTISNPLVQQKENRTWFNRFNPTGEIPGSGFKAFYFDRTDPQRIVHSENVKNIAIKYAWSDFHKINSKNFSAYWVGQLVFDEETTLQISVSTSWAKARIRINGAVVDALAEKKDAFLHTFTPGIHIIEVEYINNWHTVEFKVTFDEPISYLSASELSAALNSLEIENAKLAYVGVYEIENRDASIPVVLDETDDNMVLWLESYEAIDWKLPSNRAVQAIVVSSYKKGSRALSDQSAPVIHTRVRAKLRKGGESCHCAAGIFHCEGSGKLIGGHHAVERLTGAKLTSYAYDYSPRFVKLKPFGPEQLQKARKNKERLRAARAKCVGHANPDFDDLFGNTD